MRSIARFLPMLLLAISPLTTAAGMEFCTVKQPHHLKGAAAGKAGIKIVEVPCVIEHPSALLKLEAIGKPFIPLSDSSWTPHDVNLISLYGISIGCTMQIDGSVSSITIDINATDAKVPEGYPFTIAQVVEAARTCVEELFPAGANGAVPTKIKIHPSAPEAE